MLYQTKTKHAVKSLPADGDPNKVFETNTEGDNILIPLYIRIRACFSGSKQLALIVFFFSCLIKLSLSPAFVLCRGHIALYLKHAKCIEK